MSVEESSTHPAPARDERIHGLDNLRAVAMFLGILLHAALAFTVTPLPTFVKDASAHWSFDVVVRFIHGCRMQVFFFIAGFFGRVLYLRLGAKGFALHRLKRVGLPFLIGLPVFVFPTVYLLWWSSYRVGLEMAGPLEPRHGIDAIPTGHLWFLEYLLVVSALAIVAIRVSRRFPAATFDAMDRAFDALMQSPLRVVPFVLLSMGLLWNGRVLGDLEQAGAGFLPSVRGVTYYALFFTVGWWMHRRRGQLGELSRFANRGLAVSCCAMVTFVVIVNSEPNVADPNYTLLKLVSVTCVSLYAWLMMFAVIGMFLRFAGQHRAWMRYLADASYWCYLAHLPLIIYLQAIVAPWRLNGWLKFSVIVVVAMLVLLSIYHVGVRYTVIGSVLNGARQRPAGSARRKAVAGA